MLANILASSISDAAIARSCTQLHAPAPVAVAQGQLQLLDPSRQLVQDGRWGGAWRWPLSGRLCVRGGSGLLLLLMMMVAVKLGPAFILGQQTALAMQCKVLETHCDCRQKL